MLVNFLKMLPKAQQTQGLSALEKVTTLETKYKQATMSTSAKATTSTAFELASLTARISQVSTVISELVRVYNDRTQVP